MTTSNILFQNYAIEIFYQGEKTNTNAKAVGIKVTSVNPVDGATYTKYAGWIGASMALHGASKTPAYIYDAAIYHLHENQTEVLAAIIAFLRENNHNCRASEFESQNAKSIGAGVTYSVSHPHTNSERNAVKNMMQKNAPVGTNHM